MVKASLTMLVCVVFIACTTTARMNAPEDFGRYEEAEEYRLITAEGIVLRARVESNSPIQSLEFWAEALRNHLSNSGYLLLDELEFDADAGDGMMFDWLAPVGDDDWIYMTAIVVAEDKIVVVESAGPHELYQAYRDSIRSELGSIVVEQKLQ